jgi:glycosyltransferase involved in cell wall biosynthesis
VNVLLLVHGLEVGGTEVMVCHLARRLRARGLNVALGCLDELGELGRQLAADGFDVQVYGRRPGFDALLPWRVARHARRQRADVVHAHQYTPFFYGVLAKPLAGARLVFTEHGRAHPDLPSRRRRAFNALFSRRADRVTAVSEGVREALRAVEHFDPRRVEIVHNAIDLEAFTRVSRDEARQALGLAPDVAVVGTVGRLDPVKNHSLLLEAFRRILGDVPRARLLVVGEGPEQTGLEELAGRLGIAQAARFLGRRLDVERILPAFDVFALSSFNEGLPMTLIEAAAASVPIVSTAVGGVVEVVRHGREAILLPGPPPPLGEPEGLASAEYPGLFADALRQMLGDPGRAAALAAAARLRAQQCFSLDVVCDRYLALYAQAAGAGS